MGVDAKKFLALKKKAERLQREVDESQGALKQCLRVLKEEYGCDSIEEAAALIKKKTKALKVLEAEEAEALASFEKKWEGKL